MKQSLLSSLGPIAILSLSLWACDEPADPHGADAKKDRGGVAGTARAPATAEAPKPKLPPVLTAKAIDTEESGLSLYTIANGLAVSDGLRVGWLSEGKITWAEKQIPPKLPNVGDNRIQRVYGEWPDRIDVVYTNMNGRVMAPTYFPLTGEGHVRVFAEGGTAKWGTGQV